MDKKELLIASFIFPERVKWFFDYLKNNFNIRKDKIFIYENLDDESKIIITFKLQVDRDRRFDLKKYFPSAVIVQKKGSTFYTINALNKLIELESGKDRGNLNYIDYKIDWSEYQNQIIIIDDNKINIHNIKKINNI